MGLLLVFSEGESKVSPAEVRPGSQVEHAVAGGYDLVVVLQFVECSCVGVLELRIALRGIEGTYRWATSCTS